jgi:long-chain acyl-CoA synthetase
MNLAAAFKAAANRHPDKVALYWGEREYAYRELWADTERVAEHLRTRLGLKPGDRVGLWLKNCPEFIPALFGILLAGGVVVPLNNFLKPPEVAFMLKDADADLIIADDELAAGFLALQAERPKLRGVRVEELLKGDGPKGADFPSRN